jgi:hypothetical protein
MRHYDTINRIQDDGTLLGEEIAAYNKLDGQNICIKYSPKTKKFDQFGSRKRVFDENDEQFGDAVKWFKNSIYPQLLSQIVTDNSKKKGLFQGVDEITFYFEWYGENSFAGVHVPGEELKLALIDVFLKKKGYIEVKPLEELFYSHKEIISPELIYRGKLTKDFIKDIQENDWTDPAAKYPQVKEGVVCRRTTLMKGQRLPKVKYKTKWWMTELYKKYDKETAKLLE